MENFSFRIFEDTESDLEMFDASALEFASELFPDSGTGPVTELAEKLSSLLNQDECYSIAVWGGRILLYLFAR